ncbi:hypothetical protein MVEN_01587300 [Mycena venus]|uniref:VHS domain-containing protein n=1 Tax=Mycena venus TaxID=2733690 RepID=A0A8H6XSA8_9AGAR|nr:hypothetical protein MVEN_01587300 [Mycena venus]
MTPITSWMDGSFVSLVPSQNPYSGRAAGVPSYRASGSHTSHLDNTHDKVRTRALGLVAQWTAEFADDSTLGIMGECYEGLKAKNYKYTRPDTPPPPAVDDAIRRREEGGAAAGAGDEYAYELSDDAGAGGSSSSASASAGTAYGNANGAGAGSSYGGASSSGGGAGAYAGGYTPAAAQTRERSPSPSPVPQSTGGDASSIPEGAIVTRVRALHPFTPTEAGELGFEKGDVIKEAAVFAQAVNVERLLNMLRALDPSKGDNLADDEEIQELYRSCMALRPKIVKLIDKYSQKRADLVSMNETFVRARTIFDRMMEESLARHSGGAVPAQYYPQPQPYGAPVAATGGAWGGYPDAAAYAYAQAQAQQGQQQQQGQGQQPAAGQAGYGVYGPQGPTPYPAQQQQPQQAQQQGPTPYPAQQPAQAQTPYQQPQQQAQGPTPYPAQQQPQQAATPYQQPTQQAQTQPAAQQQAQPVQQQPAAQAQPQPQQQAQPEPQPQQQQQAAQQQAAQQQPAQQAGPPYIYDPHTTYADPNVQAWAQYYAAGGKDLAGSVYFVSIPGLTDNAPAPAPAPAAAQPAQQQVAEQQQAQQAAVAQQQAQAQVAQQQQQQQQQHRNSLGPTSPIDDDPGYFPDPYANQPEYATPTTTAQPQQGYQQPAAAQQQQQDYAQAYHQQTPSTVTSPGGSGSELAHALGPTQTQAQQYQGYSLTDPGSGSAQQQPRQGYSLTDPGSGSAGAAPSSPVSSHGHGGSAAAYGAPAGAAEPAVVAASTPSWVLPKKSPNPNARGAGSPQPGAGLTGQFAGMHV